MSYLLLLLLGHFTWRYVNWVNFASVLRRIIVTYFCCLSKWSIFYLMLLYNIKLSFLFISFHCLWMTLFWDIHFLIKWCVLTSICSSFTYRIDFSHLNHWLFYLNWTLRLNIWIILLIFHHCMLLSPWIFQINPILILLSIVHIFIHMILLKIDHRSLIWVCLFLPWRYRHSHTTNIPNDLIFIKRYHLLTSRNDFSSWEKHWIYVI